MAGRQYAERPKRAKTGQYQVDSQQLRRALGQFATGVTIITAADGAGHPMGLTVNSFSSVSLDPPLILWSLDRKSKFFAAFMECGQFAVNVLAADQGALALKFADPDMDRFGLLDPAGDYGALPAIEGAIARFECRVHEKFAGGDHVIFIGQVERFSGPGGQPLIFYQGAFRNLAAE